MQHSLESVWQQREEVVYPERFGTLSRGVFPLDFELFSNVFSVSEVDPRWLHYGVLEYTPTPHRRSWIYVTTGFSNPWDEEPTEYSTENYTGFGSELVLETSEQADWAISALRKLLAYDILLAHGRFGEPDALDVGSRIPLGGPINGDEESPVRFLVAVRPNHYEPRFILASGKADFLHFVGITESERDYAREHDTEALLGKLVAVSNWSVTNPARTAVV
jgi:hypothetical protein